MIFFYSSTGNSRHVANRLAKALNTSPTDISHFEKAAIELADTDLYVVTFNCFWGVSEKVRSFLTQTKFLHVRNVTFVLTCGGYGGGADLQIEQICKDISLPKPTIHSLKMVSNYSILHAVPSRHKQQKYLKRADRRLERIINGQAKAYKSPYLIRRLQPYVHGHMGNIKSIRLLIHSMFLTHASLVVDVLATVRYR